MQNLEEKHQIALFHWANLNSVKYPELKFLFHAPSGGLRNIVVAKKLKAMGTKPGWPDVALLVKRKPYSGLFIEMKTVRGKMSPAQIEWAKFLTSQGFRFVRCNAWEEAAGIIEGYIKTIV